MLMPLLTRCRAEAHLAAARETKSGASLRMASAMLSLGRALGLLEYAEHIWQARLDSRLQHSPGHCARHEERGSAAHAAAQRGAVGWMARLCCLCRAQWQAYQISTWYQHPPRHCSRHEERSITAHGKRDAVAGSHVNRALATVRQPKHEPRIVGVAD